MSKKFVVNEEKPRQTRPSILALATRAGVPPRPAPAMEGSVAIASTRAVMGVTEEEATTWTRITATLVAVVVLVAMVVTLAAATRGAVARGGSRNTMLETTKPRGGLPFPPATFVRRPRSRRESQPYLEAPLRPRRHQKSHPPKRLTCLASRMMMLLVAALPFLLRSVHLDSPHHSPLNQSPLLTVRLPLRPLFGFRLMCPL